VNHLPLNAPVPEPINGRLVVAARISGVITPEGFAILEDHGYIGLYHEDAEHIIQRKGLQPSANPRAYMGSSS
jgi:hypothetical protein